MKLGNVNINNAVSTLVNQQVLIRATSATLHKMADTAQTVEQSDDFRSIAVLLEMHNERLQTVSAFVERMASTA